MNRRRPKLVRLKPPPGDTQMAKTLLWLLGYVRQGRIKAMAICLIGERQDGSEFTLEHAGADGDATYELQLLGSMRLAEHNLIQRKAEREEDDEP